jgi:hypothetical protein
MRWSPRPYELRIEDEGLEVVMVEVRLGEVERYGVQVGNGRWHFGEVEMWDEPQMDVG